MKNYVFRSANEKDLEEIRALYTGATGSPGCTWDEGYPNEECTREDFKRGDLFCLKTEEGEITGVIAVDADEIVEKLPCWSRELQPGAELARLVVKESYQNQGIAKQLLQCGMEELARRGYQSVHFLVSKTNERALRAYEPLGFDNRGEWYGYEHDWWCYEKKL
ncbi:MAG TPA: N-acetyltransferase [Lachnospiraceae bacterium]|nr:N-acetyltransferase [Lachnospiraceae bacterium]